MKVKAIQEEDFTNYKECSLFIGTSFCDFKCQKENPECKCQNSSLALAPLSAALAPSAKPRVFLKKLLLWFIN